MEDLNPSVQTGEQLVADPSVETMPADPFPKSLGARWPTEESTTAADELGDRERLAPMAVPGATAGATGSSEVDARVADTTPELGAEKPVVLEEQATLPEVPKGMVGHAVRPQNPPVVLLAAAEEDEVEEIEHEEPQPQAV